MAESENGLDYLIDTYEGLYGKRPVGKWAKDEAWLEKKIAANSEVVGEKIPKEEPKKEIKKNAKYSILFNGKYIVRNNETKGAQEFGSKEEAEVFIMRHI